MTDYARVDEEVAVARTEVLRFEKLTRALEAARQQLQAERDKVNALARQLEREERGASRLEGGRLRTWLVDLAGASGQRLRERERQAAATAKLQHDAAQQVAAGLAGEVARLESELAAIGDPPARLRAALEQKERMLVTVENPLGRQLAEVANRRVTAEVELEDLTEAIDAGYEAARDLGELVTALRYAGTVGVVDLLGGGLFVTMIKHGYIDDARLVAALLQEKLLRFDQRLAAVSTGALPVGQVDIGAIVHFADFFLDGLIFDGIVQAQIVRTRQTVEDTLTYVQQMTTWLEGRRTDAETTLRTANDDRAALLRQL